MQSAGRNRTDPVWVLDCKSYISIAGKPSDCSAELMELVSALPAAPEICPVLETTILFVLVLIPFHEKPDTNQKAVIKNLRSRLSELESEKKSIPETETLRLKQVTESIRHLRRELNGENEVPPGSGNYQKDPTKKTAEERAEVMFSLYRERGTFIFNDTTKKEGKERTASLFGLPTVTDMVAQGKMDVAYEMMIRSASLVQTRNDNKNPVDFCFDKGSVEKDDHTLYRPLMNEEIHRYYVRETLQYLDEQHGDRALEVLQNISRQQMQTNLYQRLGALMDKVRGKTF